MKTQFIAFAVITAIFAPASYGAPDLLEVHQNVAERLKALTDLVLPRPIIELRDSVPTGTTPHEKILRLAQAPPPAPEPPLVDTEAITDWANNLATITTQRTLDGLFPRSAPRRPVIVGAAGDAKSRAGLEEDLNVMMRILEKAAGGKDDSRPTAGGIELFSFGRSSAPRVFYIEGNGAMFVLNVRYPLIAPPRNDPAQTNELTNTEWEKAREEVYGRRTRLDAMKLNNAPAEEFDPQRVDHLKEQIIDDLVNAKNIRGLKPEDYVTVVVLGGGSRGSVIRREMRAPDRHGGGGRGGDTYASVEINSSNVEGGNQSTMTLRVKKSDIDALANGKLEAEDFKKKVLAQVY